MKKVRNFIFFGPQGSGKGTQAKLLAKKWGLRHISSGDTLRAISRRNTSLGRYLKRQLQEGTLTPIDKLIEVFEEFMKSVPAKKGIVFDGYSRQITEARIFLRKLRKLGRKIDAAVLIDISKNESFRRLSMRGVCSGCGRPLILKGKLEVGGRCPYCKGKIVQRNDDKPEAITRRLRDYQKRTLPVVRFYQKQKLLVKINGAQSITAVYRDIVKALTKKIRSG